MAKSYDELTFADDFMFCKIMVNNQDLCCDIVELITDRKVGGVVCLNKQVPVEMTADGRGVRFDIYMKDDADTVYNVEMQTGDVDELPYRTRYYQGMIDLDLMERGAKFSDLKDSYIIFICRKNLFPKTGRHKYSFRSLCLEQHDIELGDGSTKIILSTEGNQDDLSEELKHFLAYIAGNAPDSNLTRELDKHVKQAREHVEWRKEYMTLLERDERMREEGRKEGRKEGADIAMLQVAEDMLRKQEPLEKIVLYTRLEEEKIRELAKKLDIHISFDE